jgi:hypothetical protein
MAGLVFRFGALVLLAFGVDAAYFGQNVGLTMNCLLDVTAIQIKVKVQPFNCFSDCHRCTSCFVCACSCEYCKRHGPSVERK